MMRYKFRNLIEKLFFVQKFKKTKFFLLCSDYLVKLLKTLKLNKISPKLT